MSRLLRFSPRSQDGELCFLILHDQLHDTSIRYLVLIPVRKDFFALIICSLTFRACNFLYANDKINKKIMITDIKVIVYVYFFLLT